MNSEQAAQYVEMARAVMALVGQATIQFSNVSNKVAEAQKVGRQFTDDEWRSFMAPSTQALIDLEATVKAMRQQQVELLKLKG